MRNEGSLEGLLKLRLVVLGASLTYLLVTTAQMPNKPVPYFPGPYGVFVLLMVANPHPAVLIILQRAHPTARPVARVNAFFSSLALEWTCGIAMGLELCKAGAFIGDLVSGMLPLFVIGALLGIAWRVIVCKIIRQENQPESMFP